MAEENENVQDISALRRSLKKAIADVKSRQADRDDVVVDMKEAEGARLQLLADELRPLMQEIDESDDRFEFALTKGEKPRLWIDMTSFVSMGHDKRSYRFIKDTRMGRIILAETGDMQKAADIVSEYVAEKVIERERILEGEWVSQKHIDADKDNGIGATADGEEDASAVQKKKGSAFGRFFWFLFGATCALGALVGAAFFMAPDAF